MRFFEERQLPTIGDHALTSLPDDQSVITGKKMRHHAENPWVDIPSALDNQDL